MHGLARIKLKAVQRETVQFIKKNMGWMGLLCRRHPAQHNSSTAMKAEGVWAENACVGNLVV